MTGDAAGSTATVTIFFARVCLIYRDTPVNVPPVPTPATNASILPSVSSQISGPVVFSWIAGFAGLSNWRISTYLLGSAAASSSAFAIAPFIPLAPGCQYQFGTKGDQNFATLHGHRVGHGKYATIAP